ncbi:MAG: nitrilase-related carbon-nitrogen hydrolase [Chloroflexota bacterium]
MRFLWLALFALFMVIGNGRFGIIAAWLSSIFAIRFFRQSEKGWRGFLWLWLATAVTSSIAWYNVTAMRHLAPFAEPLFFTLTAPIALIPFVVDRLYNHRWADNPKLGFWLTLVFPISYTALDFFSASDSPFGSFGAVAYSQMGFTSLMQITAVFGLWILPFLIGWFASLVNYAWENNFAWPTVKRGFTIYTAILLLILGLSWGRLQFASPATQTVNVGGYSLTETTFGNTLELARSGNEPAFRQAASDLNSQHLIQIRALAQEGAEIVSLQEGAGMGYAEEIDALITGAATIAQEENIYIVLPTVQLDPTGVEQFQNVVRIIDPSGAVALEHFKYGGTQFEGSVTGSGELQAIETPLGTLSAIICWDADFSETMQQAGKQEIDLLFVPSNDWFELRDIHAGMATFRAVENGVPIFRQTGSGVSTVIDAYGRVVSRVNSFDESGTGLWSSEQIVATPIGSVNTLYPQIGDIFGQMMLIGLVGLLGFAWLKRKRAEGAMVSEPAPTPVH